MITALLMSVLKDITESEKQKIRIKKQSIPLYMSLFDTIHIHTLSIDI